MKRDNENKAPITAFRALITDAGLQDDDTFEVVFATENPVLRFDWDDEVSYDEVLMCRAENIDTSRIDIGLPIFDNHPWDYSVTEQLGRTVSYKIENNQCTAKIKLGARADEALRNDIKNKIITSVSVGYFAFKYERDTTGAREKRNITMWQPFEISFAPVPADVKSIIRAHEAQKAATKPESLSIFSNIKI